MAMDMGSGPRTGRRKKFHPVAAINVTPMVDVMLVLLIIFMVTAPLLTAGVPVDLPQTSAAPLSNDDQPITVSIKGDGTIWLQDTQVTLDQLAPRVQAVIGAKSDTKVYVRGDAASNYGAIMQVMSALSTAGMTHLALITQPAQGSGTPAPATGKGSAPARGNP